MNPFFKTFVAASAISLSFTIPTTTWAVSLKEATQKSVLNNPEVLTRWHAFAGAQAEQDAARGGFFPRIDVNANAGRQYLSQPNDSARSYDSRGTGITLNQMLFDGFATRSEVRRLGYSKLVRYYELMDASENAALEAARAYYDVLRYRKLVKLAEENYSQHKITFDQIEQRVQAGVGRRVDLEQAGGRLALAESNLITEISNLHDVSARYQRIVGELPPENMEEPPLLNQAVPAEARQAALRAIESSPLVSAAIENIRAAHMAIDERQSSFYPRVNFRARQNWEQNRNGVKGDFEDRAMEVVLSYNIFRGGSDSALKRQAAENLNAAKDLRDKACRDVRQTAAIAFNDIRKLAEQLRFLDAHQLASEKARDAYRKQFDIGQRTLLDLLDTENELFQARRAYVNAQAEYGIAFARTQAAMGQLLSTLGLRKLDTPSPAQMGEEPFAVDPATSCPPDVPSPAEIDRNAVLAKAAANAAPAIEVKPIILPKAASPEEEVRKSLAQWSAAWVAKDVNGYLASYSKNFAPDRGMTRGQWEAQRRARLAAPASIRLDIRDVNIEVQGSDRAITTFVQQYESERFSDVVTKTLVWARESDGWRIVSESAVAR